jgi:hypothetical protein
MLHHVRANLLFAHTLGYFVLAPEVCFQDQQVSLFRRPRLSRHSRRARTPMYSPISKVVVMQERSTLERRSTSGTMAVVGNRVVCIMPAAAGWRFRSARLVPAGDSCGSQRLARPQPQTRAHSRTSPRGQENKVSETSCRNLGGVLAAKPCTKDRHWGEVRRFTTHGSFPNRIRPPTPGSFGVLVARQQTSRSAPGGHPSASYGLSAHELQHQKDAATRRMFTRG